MFKFYKILCALVFTWYKQMILTKSKNVIVDEPNYVILACYYPVIIEIFFKNKHNI